MSGYKTNHIKSLGLVFALLFAGVPVQGENSGIIEWENTTPEFSSLGLPLSEVEALLGHDGQLLIVKHPVETSIWSQGEVKQFAGVRYSIASTIIASDMASIRKQLLDMENLGAIMSQVKNEEILETSGKQQLVEFDQVYNIPGPINLKAKFRIQVTEHEDGDITWLIHKGDVDTGVSRWEFVELDQGRTLVSLTNWQDLNSAGLAFKALLKAQPELKPVIPVIATNMYLQQLKMFFQASQKFTGNKQVDNKVNIPSIVGSGYSLKLMNKLIEQGTIILVHPEQLIDYQGKQYSMLFTTAMNTMDGPIKTVKPISSNYKRMAEYFPWAYQIDTRTLDDGEEVELHLKIKLPLISMKLRNTLQSRWKNDNAIIFEAKSGAMNPMFGSWEYMPFQGEKTIMAFTSASKVGDDANWMLKMIRKVPLTDLVLSTYMGMMIVEKQKPWVESELSRIAEAEAL